VAGERVLDCAAAVSRSSAAIRSWASCSTCARSSGCPTSSWSSSPGEAAGQILDEALQPFLDDMRRRAKLGMTTAAAELAVGVLCGVHEIPDSAPPWPREGKRGKGVVLPIRDRRLR
jgi:hypothetical protein